jgi:serine/threonine protein kinase
VGAVVACGYEVIGHLHRSNNFDVYDVWSEERACRCIAKLPCPDLLDDPEVSRKLLREGRLLHRLKHPHIVRAYETIRRPHPVLILETLTGETLAHLIATRERRLPLSDVICLGVHLCSAIHYLHRHGILHLDLKPSNIVSERGLAKVLDLSIARRPGRGGKGSGTVNYMAPEQCRGDLLSAATDVWGIGAVLFEATTDEVPFDAYDDEEEDRYDQLERRVESVREHRRVPKVFADLVAGCLEPYPALRPTVGELMKRLTALA